MLRVSNVTQTLSRSRLGVPSVVFFVMSAAAPLTVIAGGVTTAYAVTGLAGLPVAFLAIAVVLALFSVGYVAMARHITNAGAFYTYVARGLGRPAGVGAALIAVLAYNAIQVALYGGLGAAAAALVGGTIPWWVYALGAWLFVALLGVLRVDLNGYILAVLLVAEIVVVLVYDAVFLAHPAGGAVSFAGLAPADLLVDGIGAALVFGVTAFVGFEAAAVFSEETRNPRRTVPVATYVAVVLIGVLYAGSSWALSVATGPASVVAVAGRDGTETIFVLAAGFLGPFFVDLGHVLFVTSLLAALLSFHNAVARYLFALGRERVLPRALGRTSRRTGAPKVASLVQSLVALCVVVLYAVAGLDPLVQLFFWVGTTGGFGVLVLLATTSVAIIGYFARRPGGENVWRRLLAPALSATLLTAVVCLAVANFPVLLGVSRNDPLRWILPSSYVVAGLIGVVWALLLRGSRPAAYYAIGLGADGVPTAGADGDPAVVSVAAILSGGAGTGKVFDNEAAAIEAFDGDAVAIEAGAATRDADAGDANVDAGGAALGGADAAQGGADAGGADADGIFADAGCTYADGTYADLGSAALGGTNANSGGTCPDAGGASTDGTNADSGAAPSDTSAAPAGAALGGPHADPGSAAL